MNTPVTWVAINNRFECPMCGSKYELDGSLFSGGISPRNLDRLYMRVFTPDDTIEVDSLEDSALVDITTIRELWIDRTRVYQGRERGV